MLLDLDVVTMAVETGVDFNEVGAVVVADGSSTKEGVEDVALVNTAVVEAEVVLMVDRALREDGGDGDDTP
uniref:Uncharacterized protein n=1 Tax=Triticum urartu TaxID=4572 RepID=A0A8R7K075_TRIUA